MPLKYWLGGLYDTPRGGLPDSGAFLVDKLTSSESIIAIAINESKPEKASNLPKLSHPISSSAQAIVLADRKS